MKRLLAGLLVLGWAGACSDTPGGPKSIIEPPPPPNGLVVSDPVLAAAAAASSAGAFAAVAGEADSLVYVSLPPGAQVDGVTATVRTLTSSSTLTTAVSGGGFDAVPVSAHVGDTVEVVVRNVSGAVVLLTRDAVAMVRRPIVVRTDPPPRKRDVPLNSVIVIVFSEPVAEATLNPASVRLFRGTTSIPGSVRLLASSATAAVFQPASSLDPNADYRLIVSQDVRDLAGDALDAPMTVDFTTGTAIVGLAHLVFVVPDTTALAIGSQVQLAALAVDSVTGRPVTGKPIRWTSLNPAVATVSPAGLATALTNGEASIQAEVDLGSGVGVVVVAALAPVDSVEVTPESPTVPVSGSIALSAIMRDSAGNVLPFRPVTWASSNPAVAMIASSSGANALITSRAAGTATITAASEGVQDQTAITVVTTGPYVRLDVANGQTCGVTTDDWAFCWGWNAYGQIGIGRVDDEFVPVPTAVSGGLRFSHAGVGWGNSCAVTPDGQAYCWGVNEFGQLGIGSTATSQDCPRPPLPAGYCAHTPVAVTGGHQFTTIELGHEFACGLTAAGAAYCWGLNDEVRLGSGLSSGPEDCHSQSCSTVPIPVAGGLTFSSIAVGDGGGCGLTSSGAAYCWGDNWTGQIGDGTMTARPTAVPVAGNHVFRSISAGGSHTCGVTTLGQAYCWGRNDAGQLGLGTFTGPEICAQPGGQLPACSTVPVLVPGLSDLASISVGWHSCALTRSGAAYCWGPNWYGGLGIGNITLPQCGITAGNPVCSTSPVAVVGGLTFATLSARAGHTCGVTPSRVAYCWGENNAGQLGIGVADQDRHYVPERVSGQP